MRNKIEKFVFNTKLGHFVALFVPSVLLDLVFLIVYPKLFLPAMVGSLFTAMFICLTDGNKRWV